MEQGDKRSHPAFDRICYTDEKPVFFMSMFAFFNIIFMFDGHKKNFFFFFNHPPPILPPRLPSLASVPFEISIDIVIADITKNFIF